MATSRRWPATAMLAIPTSAQPWDAATGARVASLLLCLAPYLRKTPQTAWSMRQRGGSGPRSQFETVRQDSTKSRRDRLAVSIEQPPRLRRQFEPLLLRELLRVPVYPMKDGAPREIGLYKRCSLRSDSSSPASRWDSLFYAGQGSTLRVSTTRIHSSASPSLLLRSGLGAPSPL